MQGNNNGRRYVEIFLIGDKKLILPTRNSVIVLSL